MLDQAAGEECMCEKDRHECDQGILETCSMSVQLINLYYIYFYYYLFIIKNIYIYIR